MSFFTVKMIAIITMLIDHIGVAIGSPGLMVISYDNTLILRSIGRIALPIFAYNIVNGWKFTRDKSNYVFRLILFACISQIPFSLVTNPQNYSFRLDTINSFTSLNFAIMPVNFWIVAAVFIVSHLIIYKDTNLKLTAALIIATTFSLVTVYTNYNLIYTNSYKLNVFYTLGTAAYILRELEAFRESKDENISLTRIFRVVSLFSIAYLFCSYSDYSFMGLFLILAIYATRHNKWMQLSVIAFWCIYTYSGYMPFLISALISVLILYLYNGKKGYQNKFIQILTYIFYPLHLSILGIIILFKLL